MGLIVFVGTLLIVIIIPQLYDCLRRRTLDTKSALQKRQKTIHRWLITKTIPHPTDTNKAAGSSSSTANSSNISSNSNSSKSNSSTTGTSCDDNENVDIETGNDDDDDDYARECMICMEPFAGGESVSWSIHCDHVFHDVCLTEWLMKHATCPYCRQPVLPAFERSAITIKKPRKELEQMQADRTKRSAMTRYTLEDGFVSVPNKEGNGTEINETASPSGSSNNGVHHQAGDGNGNNDDDDDNYYVEGLVVRNDNDNATISEREREREAITYPI